ncbi:MAG TPA: class II aldolase/adducin family protein [Acidobacteriota bacterium]
MRSGSRKATEEAVTLFQAVGRASLIYDIQDSHSGNMAVKIKEADGREVMAVTATGSQKGDLEPDQVCFFPFSETDYRACGASTESIIHARVLGLEGVQASLHAHTKDLMIATLDDEPKPNEPRAFGPLDPLGFFHLKGLIPVEWVRVPSGSPEMAELICSRLADYPAVVIQAHGLFARGRTLPEAFFHACLANNSGSIVRLLERLKVDLNRLRAEVASDPGACFDLSLSDYELGTESLLDVPGDKVREDFAKTGARMFESRLSPFHTGSISKRGRKDMLFAPQASRPRELGGPLRSVSLERQPDDTPEAERHKALYAASDFQTLLHCYLPEAEAQAHRSDPATGRPAERITAIDAEGGFLYPVVPVLPPRPETAEIARLLQDHKMVVVRGGGVWAAGRRSLSEVLHHPSSLREICLYRLGAFERGLDLRKMESARS